MGLSSSLHRGMCFCHIMPAGGRGEEWETAWCSVANELYCSAGNTTYTWFSPGKLYSIKYRSYRGEWSQPHKSFFFQDKLRGIVHERYQIEFSLLLSVWCALFSPAAPSGSIYKTDERLKLRATRWPPPILTHAKIYGFTVILWSELCSSCILYQHYTENINVLHMVLWVPYWVFSLGQQAGEVELAAESLHGRITRIAYNQNVCLFMYKVSKWFSLCIHPFIKAYQRVEYKWDYL